MQKDVRSVRAVYVHQKNMRATGECVHTLRRTHSSCYHVGANTVGTTPTKKKLEKNSSLHDHLERMLSDFLQVLFDLSHRIWSTSLLSTNHQMCDLVLLGFPRHAPLLILDHASVWSFE